MKLPNQPRLRSAEIAVWAYREKPGGFTINDVMAHFDGATTAESRRKKRGEYQRRINYLLIWGLIRGKGKLEAHRRGRREMVYGMTRWGERYAAKIVKDGKPSQRVAANPKKAK